MKKRKGPDDESSTESAEAADSDLQELAGFLDDSATWGWRLIENRIPCHEGMDLPRDGPDRPACIVMWYSAPVAEELREGYTEAQHASISIVKGCLHFQQGKKLVCICCHNCMSHDLKQIAYSSKLAATHFARSMCNAGTLSSSRTSLPMQHCVYLMSRTWGRRGERIGEARNPGPATEAVVTRKGEGQQPQKNHCLVLQIQH